MTFVLWNDYCFNSFNIQTNNKTIDRQKYLENHKSSTLFSKSPILQYLELNRKKYVPKKTQYDKTWKLVKTRHFV